MKMMRILQTLMLLCLGVTNAVIIHYSEEHRNETRRVDQEGFITCMCDGQKKTEKLPKNSLEKVFQSIRRHNYCGQNDSSSICSLLKECESCKAEMQKCAPIANKTNQFDCLRRRFVMNENHFTNPNKATLDAKDRLVRQVPACAYPTNLKTSDLICTKYPSSIKCRQKCIFGHTLKEGISRNMKCLYKEDVWKPTGFEECLPFVDCTMTLVSTGKLDCVTGTTKSPPACNVTCDQYEDKRATPMKTYQCRISGAWSIKTPFCAIPGSGLDLVPAPRIKLHPLSRKV